MSKRSLIWIAAALMVLLLTGALVLRVATSRPQPRDEQRGSEESPEESAPDQGREVARRAPSRGLVATMNDKVIATFGNGGELTEGEYRAALDDLEILRRAGVGDPMLSVAQQMMGGSPSELIMLMLTAQPVVIDGRVVDVRRVEPGQAGAMWSTLLYEAHRMGLKADRPRVDAFLSERFRVIDRKTLAEYLAEQFGEGTVPLERFREAVENLLLISMAFDNAAGEAPKEEAALRHLFEEQAARVDLALLVFRAADFVDHVEVDAAGTAFEEEIQALFEAGKAYRRGSPDSPNPGRFGYRLPDQVKVEYAFVPLAAAMDVVEVSDEDILQYREANQERLTEVVRTARAEDASTRPAATQTGEVPAYLVKGEARRQLRQERADAWAMSWAADVLAKAQEVAVEQADHATVSPLQEAVEATSADVPVRYEAADEWMGWVDLRQDLVLGAAMTLASQPESLPSVAMQTAELLDESQRSSAATSVGEIYPQVMRVYGARSGFLVWRVTDARESSPPAEIDETIREALTSDWRSMKAYDLAVQAANDAMSRLGEASLETIAAEREMEVHRVEDLTRLRIADPLTAARELMAAGYAPAAMDWQALQARAVVAELMQSGSKSHQLIETVTPEGLAIAALQKPFVQFAPPIGPLGAVDEATRKVFLDAIFEMVPAEPSETPTSSAPAGAACLVELPEVLSAAVAQRREYTPAREEDYREQREGLLSVLALLDRQEALWRWMDPAEIEARTGLETVRPGEAE